MSPGAIAVLQTVTAVTAAGTAIINVLALVVKRAVNPDAMAIISRQSKALESSNKRITKSLNDVNAQMVTRMANIESRISTVQAVVERL